MVERIKQLIREPELWLSRLAFLIGPFLCLLMVETLNENDVFTVLTPLQVAFNLVWYFALFTLVRIIVGSNRRAAVFSSWLCFIVGLIDHFVLRNSGRALWPADILVWQTALNVAGTQNYSLDVYIVLAAIVLTVYMFLILICPPRGKGNNRLSKKTVAAALVSIASFNVIFFCSNAMPALGLYPQQWNTRMNGFALNFALAARSMVYSEPDGYQEERVLELAKQFPGSAGDPSQQPENILVIMNESFADFSIYERFQSSEDPLPYFHSLQGSPNTISGVLYSPVWSGGTATVEHEFLTGFSSLYQPPHTVAYQLYLHDDTPSMAEAAAAAGYETIAFHPYLSSGWNRVQVYNYMGFDQQMYQADVNNPRYVRDYISDSSDYETLMQLTEEHHGKTFVFNVTMQNHNGYDQQWTNLGKTITLPESLSKIDPGAEQYFSALRESDKALEELIRYYQSCEERTLIVFFGDHQPPLSASFYEYLLGTSLNDMTPEEQALLYKVPFFVWANYDIGTESGLQMTPALLGTYASGIAGLPMTGLQQFLSKMQTDIPVLCSVGIMRPDGTLVSEWGDMTETERRWYEEYEQLTYTGLMNQFDGTWPLFHIKKMTPK